MEEIFAVIEKIGALIAIIAYAIYKFFEKRKEAQKEAHKKIQQDEQKRTHSPQFVLDIGREIKHEARKIRDRHAAMRVFVIHFSNGTITETGFPLFKITFDHEVVLDYGVQVERISQNFQEITMPDMFTSPMTITFKIGEFYLKDIEDLNINDTHQRDYYDWLKAYGVGSVMWLLIKKKGKPAAILVSQWPRQTDLEGTIIARIKDIKRNIEKIYEGIQEI